MTQTQAVVLFVALAGNAYAFSTCPPAGPVLPSEGGTITGNTCGQGNAYTPANAYQHPSLGAPESGALWMAPAGPFSIRLTAGFRALAEVRDIQGRDDCRGGVYAFARWPTKPGGMYTGFDAPRALVVVVDGQYRGDCGDFSLTVTPTPPN